MPRLGAGGLAAPLIMAVIGLLVVGAAVWFGLRPGSGGGATGAPAETQAAQPPVATSSARPTATPGSRLSTAAAKPAGTAIPAIDPTWLRTTSARTGIGERALAAYAGSALQLSNQTCRIGWNQIAAIGYRESNHGNEQGSALNTNGVATPPIIGVALDGGGVAAIPDTDRGALDGDTRWDRAVGPMQFLPATWQTSGADGNGDGIKDPQQIDDAALATGRYLCAAGNPATPAGWQQAVLAYNNSPQYLADVTATANEYAARAGG